MNSVDIANALITRVRNLQEFEVRRHISGPLFFNGVVPFDITINEDCAWFKVLAISQDEAELMVDNWLSTRNDY
jgi:hypothetical protein